MWEGEPTPSFRAPTRGSDGSQMLLVQKQRGGPEKGAHWLARVGGPQGIHTSLGDLDRKGMVDETHPQQMVHNTFWISWFLKA